MNWKVWTPFQFVNINFVPVQVCAGFHQNPVTDNHLLWPHLSILFPVQSAVCQHCGLVLVCLPRICEEVKQEGVEFKVGFSSPRWPTCSDAITHLELPILSLRHKTCCLSLLFF